MMYGRGYYGYGDMMGGGWFVGLFMLLLGALFIAAVVLLVMWAVRVSSGHAHGGSPMQSQSAHDEAVTIARRRLAAGEITKEQFDEIMRALGT